MLRTGAVVDMMTAALVNKKSVSMSGLIERKCKFNGRVAKLCLQNRRFAQGIPKSMAILMRGRGGRNSDCVACQQNSASMSGLLKRKCNFNGSDAKLCIQNRGFARGVRRFRAKAAVGKKKGSQNDCLLRSAVRCIFMHKRGEN